MTPAASVERVLTEEVAEAMEEAKISTVEVTWRMRPSRSQLGRVLDPGYSTVQPDLLIKAASTMGRDLRILLKRFARARSCRWPTPRGTECLERAR